MRREQRLRANADFLRVRREGRSWAHPLLVLYVARRVAPGDVTRVGVTVRRAIGGAVVRNRVRRRVREAVGRSAVRISTGWDLVFVARPAVATASFGQVVGSVESLLARSGVLTAGTECAGSSLP